MGEGVTGLAPGAHVIGVDMRGGAFAEYMALPAAAAVPVPAGWADEQALGLVVNWPTALAALRPLGRLTAGQTVLIHAAAGATGQAAVTMARHYGATVIATASPGKHETLRALGADHVLDSRRTDLAAEVLRLTGGARRRPGARVGRRRHLRRQPGRRQAGHRPGRRLRRRSAATPRSPTGNWSTSTRSTSSA